MILILQDAFHPKEFLTLDHHSVFLVNVRIRNHVRKSCFIYFARPCPYFFRFSNTTETARPNSLKPRAPRAGTRAPRIASSTGETHRTRAPKLVSDPLRRHGLFKNRSALKFMAKFVAYFGHIRR